MSNLSIALVFADWRNSVILKIKNADFLVPTLPPYLKTADASIFKSVKQNHRDEKSSIIYILITDKNILFKL